MPFADDIRKYNFESLEKLHKKKGELVTAHSYLPTEEQTAMMRKFVHSLDLMEAGGKDEKE